MEKTKNYNLKKPGAADFYDVADFNENADVVDELLKQHEDAITKERNTVAEISNSLRQNGYGEIAGGKNLFNYNKVEQILGYWSNLTTEHENDKVYSVRLNLQAGTYTVSSAFSYGAILYVVKLDEAEMKTLSYVSYENGKAVATFTIDEDLVIAFQVNGTATYDDSKINALIKDIQLEEGSTATEHESYYPSNKMLEKENVALATEMLNVKMLGWSVPKECPVQNEVSGDQFIQKVGRIILNGTENWNYHSGSIGINGSFYFNFNGGQKSLPDGEGGYFTRFKTGSIAAANMNAFVGVDTIQLRVDDCTDTTFLEGTSKIKQWLSQNNTAVYYELATPITKTIDGNEIGETVSDVRKETTVNLLKPTLATTTQSGVTCTNNGDGTYTLNGTASAETTFIVQIIGNIVEKYANKDLWLVGCPKNGSMNTYRQHFWCEGQEMMFDTGSGTKFRIENTTKNANIAIIIEPGTTTNNLVFKPMITTNLNATYDDFVPYTGSTGGLNSDLAEVVKMADNLKQDKMDAENPTGAGAFSLNRKSGTVVGSNSHAEGNQTTASGSNAHAEGDQTTASGINAHAEGVYGKASGMGSHSEGRDTSAGGIAAHAEGDGSMATTSGSHAEGYYSKTYGTYAHAEGKFSKANGSCSHAEGLETIATGANSHVQGKYNIEDTAEKYAHIIGAGTSGSARKNIHTVDWEGNAYFAGDLQTGENGTPFGYEEGEWTPSTTSALNFSKLTNCKYKKIGNVVFIQAYLIADGSASMWTIDGLPYPVATSGATDVGSVQALPIQYFLNGTMNPTNMASYNGTANQIVCGAISASGGAPLVIQGYYFTE